MTTPAVTPTPDEITAALDTLRRIPDIDDQATLGAIERSNYPLRWMARDLHAQLAVDFPEHPGALAIALSASAARHGLCITADPEPGELIQYRVLHPTPFKPTTWDLSRTQHAHKYEPTSEGLADAERDIAPGQRIAAVYLLPEGGKA